MALTPIDVQQKTFGTALRGYDLDEVDDFLDQVVTALKSYEQRLSDAQERITKLETDAASRGDSESVISRALVAAQRSADQIVEEAQAEAGRITTQAEADAERMLNEAAQSADAAMAQRDAERARLESEAKALRVGVSELREKVRNLMRTLEEDVDEVEQAIDATEEALESEAAADTGGTVTEEPTDVLPFEETTGEAGGPIDEEVPPPEAEEVMVEDEGEAEIESWLIESEPEEVEDSEADEEAGELFEELSEVGDRYSDEDDFDDLGVAQQIERVRRPWESD